MADSAYRQILMLKRIPSLPKSVSTTDLCEYLLHQEGFDVTERTVQRDLAALSKIFELVCDQRNKPYGWSFKKYAIFDIPVMDSAMAITFDMVGRHLKELLPTESFNAIRPQIERARKRLNSLELSKTTKWSKKFAWIPEGLQLVSADILPNVLEKAYQAVLEERQLTIDRGFGSEKIHPLGVIHRGRIIYLVATFYDYDDIRLLSLQRIKKVSLITDKAKRPPSFNLEQFISDGALQFSGGAKTKEIALKLRFFGHAGENLRETPLSYDQKICDPTGERNTKTVLATVEDNMELRWWILGFGDQVEVMSPKALRSEFACISNQMAHLYRG